jgi:hypothetical protein
MKSGESDQLQLLVPDFGTAKIEPNNREIDVTETSFYVAFSTFNLLLLLTTTIVLSNLYAKARQLTQNKGANGGRRPDGAHRPAFSQ